MNKKELLQKADELIKEANELKELANQEEILVPDNIKIIKYPPEFGIWLWIINWEKAIHYDYDKKDWCVYFNTGTPVKCKLTPCKYEDLEAWDLFYRSDEEDEDFGSPHKYAIKINDWSYQFWEGNNCINGSTNWNYYWKVEPI